MKSIRSVTPLYLNRVRRSSTSEPAFDSSTSHSPGMPAEESFTLSRTGISSPATAFEVGTATGTRSVSLPAATSSALKVCSAEVAVVHPPSVPGLNSATGGRLDGDGADRVGESDHSLVRARLVARRVRDGPAPGVSVVARCAGERLCWSCCQSGAPEHQGPASGPGNHSLDHLLLPDRFSITWCRCNSPCPGKRGGQQAIGRARVRMRDSPSLPWLGSP